MSPLIHPQVIYLDISRRFSDQIPIVLPLLLPPPPVSMWPFRMGSRTVVGQVVGLNGSFYQQRKPGLAFYGLWVNTKYSKMSKDFVDEHI